MAACGIKASLAKKPCLLPNALHSPPALHAHLEIGTTVMSHVSSPTISDVGVRLPAALEIATAPTVTVLPPCACSAW